MKQLLKLFEDDFVVKLGVEVGQKVCSKVMDNMNSNRQTQLSLSDF